MDTYHPLQEYDVRHILVRHEQCAAHAADGYARASGRVGVAIATSGPGATNLVTGIATAMMDSSPIVCITGQVHTPLIGSDAFQETDITGITLPITKHNYLVTDVDDLAGTIQEAFYIARSGRPGPVLIDLPKDVQQAETDFAPPEEKGRLPGYQPAGAGDAEAVRQAAEMINSAQRPVILAGHGVLMSGAMEALKAFVEKTKTPVALTLLGKGGFPESHPLTLGMMGMHGEAFVNRAIQEADLLLAFGMRFDDRVTGKLEHYAPHARKVHVDMDSAELNKIVPVDVAILGDLRQVLEQFLPLVAPASHQEWLEQIAHWQDESHKRDIVNQSDNGHVVAPQVIHALWEATQGEAIVVTDVGQHQMWAAQYYHLDRPHPIITSGGLGTMGFGLPAAIGAQVARPDKEVWAIVGDGGFQMTAQELGTVIQEQLPLRIALLGINVIVGGAPERKRSWEKARQDGWQPGKTLFPFEEAVERATIIQYLVSDAGQMLLWPRIKPCLKEGDALYFSHGFAIVYNDQTGIVPPEFVDVILVAPKGSGRSVRANFLTGSGINSSYAVYQDYTGRATERVIATGIAVGSGYLFPTTFQGEVHSDLTGERGVLMGALAGIMEAQYAVLRQNGHSPSEAFNETVEELTQSLIRLVGENGMDWMYANCSTTAQRGALDWRHRFREAVAPVFEKLYKSVVAGEETRIVLAANSAPDYKEKLEAELREMRESEMWRAGAAVRSLRPENWRMGE